MHLALTHARRHLQETSQKNRERRNKGIEAEEINEGDAVYIKNNRRVSKLDPRWLPYYRVIRQTGPHSYLLKHQVHGTVIRAHLSNMRKSTGHKSWGLPPAPRARYEQLDSSSSSSDDNDDNNDNETSSDNDNGPADNDNDNDRNDNDNDSDATELYDPNDLGDSDSDVTVIYDPDDY